MDKILTIVIPTYNMEKYLDKCISSLIVNDNKLMNLLDIIIVNDGSKDNSSKIAHEYSKQYSGSIRVIDKENGNYGSCINRGLYEAKGKYIKILDADDSYEKCNWIKLLNILCNVDADLILTDYDLVDENDNTISHRNFKFKQNVCISANTDVKELGEVEMHAITYKTQVLKDMKYMQTEGISYTDTEWVLIPMQNIKTMYYTPITVYKYLVGRQGQTMDESIYLKNRKHITIIMSRLIHEIHNNKLFISPMADFYRFRILGLYSRYYTTSLINNKFPSNELINLDNDLKLFCKEIYDSLSKISFSKIEYIKLWRDNNYNLPYITKLIIKIIKFKRKYLSNIKLGREKKDER